MWDTLGDWGCAGLRFVDVDELVTVCEVRFEPGEGSASDVKGGLKTGEEDRVIYGVESSTEVK